MRPTPRLGLVLAALLALAGCDRNVEPFDPNEQPHQPDLSHIFPEGAERAQEPIAGMPQPPPAPGSGPRGAAPVSGGAPVSGTIRLAPGLEDRVPDGAVLFLIARRGAAGPPLAVKRLPAPRFPYDFELGPEDRMIKSMPFVGPMELSARLDRDGNATSRTPGDIQGQLAEPASPGETGLVLVLDEVL